MHKVPISFDCQDGECGSCLVEVTHYHPEKKCAIALTEKEKELLKQLKKITPKEIYDAEVNDMPPRYRLACQCFVRNEDILVSFEGDQTLQPPDLSRAAKIFKGGIQVKSVEEFLGYSATVEEDAAVHFEELAASMAKLGNQDVSELFSQLATFSRKQLAKARKRVGSADYSKEIPPDYLWPDHVTPEQTAHWAGDRSLARLGALRAALQGERRGYEFYCSVAGKPWPGSPLGAPMVNCFPLAGMRTSFITGNDLDVICRSLASGCAWLVAPVEIKNAKAATKIFAIANSNRIVNSWPAKPLAYNSRALRYLQR